VSIRNHFDAIADVFNRIWYFSDEYKDFITQHILSDLSLSQQDTLADIGGGTGSFTSRLSTEANLLKAYCIEPSSAMCEEAAKLCRRDDRYHRQSNFYYGDEKVTS
jgi:ubiquinone/menaquinone biosynthesis C-methylase UbiE